MKEKTLLILLFLLCKSMFGQSLLFQEANIREVNMNDKERRAYEKLSKADNVTDFSLIHINTKEFQASESLLLAHRQFSTTANLLKIDARDNSNYTWFGALGDGTGIFFTVLGDKVFSKFYLGDIPYSVVPLSDGYHMLIGFDQSVMDTECGHEHHKFDSAATKPQESTEKKHESTHKNLIVDDNCNLRVLLVFTDDADAALDMQIIGQGMVDETNLAYMMSDIGFSMELARTVTINYTQTNTTTPASPYGLSYSYPTDLVNIRNGANGFGDIPLLRDLYQADVVVLVREGLAVNAYGVAFGIPTGAQYPDAQNAFALINNDITLTTLIGGRFTFAHEIGHVQGARHDIHNASPDYARGNVFNTTNQGKTIMAIGGSCPSATGCRVNFFSNPDITFGGTPTGTATRDNARRLDETSVAMRNLRMTDDNLTVSGETFENESIANHLANQTITTSGNVDAENGARVTMRAGGAICLTPGFEAKAGSVFTAYTKTTPCDNLPANLTQEDQEDVEETTLRNSTHVADTEITEYESLMVKNFPNPFTGQTTIEFVLPEANPVTLFVSDMDGRKIAVLLDNKAQIKGTHQVIFDGGNYPAGMYYYTIQAGQHVRTQKMILTK